LLANNQNRFIVSGRLTDFIDTSKTKDNISVFKSTKEVLEALYQEKQQVS